MMAAAAGGIRGYPAGTAELRQDEVGLATQPPVTDE